MNQDVKDTLLKDVWHAALQFVKQTTYEKNMLNTRALLMGFVCELDEEEVLEYMIDAYMEATKERRYSVYSNAQLKSILYNSSTIRDCFSDSVIERKTKYEEQLLKLFTLIEKADTAWMEEDLYKIDYLEPLQMNVKFLETLNED